MGGRFVKEKELSLLWLGDDVALDKFKIIKIIIISLIMHTGYLIPRSEITLFWSFDVVIQHHVQLRFLS